MIVQLEDLAEIRRQYNDKKVVLTSGTFDLFHVGHLRYLQAAKDKGDILVVMLSGDNRVKARKGPNRPIINENDRAQILDALKIVDYVFIDPGKSAPDKIDQIHAVIIKGLNPDIYVTDGEDIRFSDILDKSKQVLLPRTNKQISTSEIIQQIVKRH